MSKTDRIIEAVVALVFGLAILLTTIFGTSGDGKVAVIILGALITAAGLGCLVWALVDKSASKAVVKEAPAKKAVKAPAKKSTAKKLSSK